MPDRLDPTFVRREIDALRYSHPDVMDDEELWQLALTSETDLHEFLTVVVKRMGQTEANIEGIGDWIAELKARQQRFEQRCDAMRSLAFKLMQQAAVKKVELPLATLSIRAGQPRIIITNEAALPSDCVRIKREPDKIAIKEHLARGEPVPGAELSNSEPVLAVRIK